jgi:hypothetical protein
LKYISPQQTQVLPNQELQAGPDFMSELGAVLILWWNTAEAMQTIRVRTAPKGVNRTVAQL